MRRLTAVVISASGFWASACATLDMRAPSQVAELTTVELALAQAVDDLSVALTAAGWTSPPEERQAAAAAAFNVLVHGFGKGKNKGEGEAGDETPAAGSASNPDADPVARYLAGLPEGETAALLASHVAEVEAGLVRVNVAAEGVIAAGLASSVLANDVAAVETAFSETRRARLFLAAAADRAAPSDPVIDDAFAQLDAEMKRTSGLADTLAIQARPAPGVS